MEVVFIGIIVFLVIIGNSVEEAIIGKENKKKSKPPPKPPPIPYEPTEFVKDVCMWGTYSKSTKEEILLNASNEDIISWCCKLRELSICYQVRMYLKSSYERAESVRLFCKALRKEMDGRNLNEPEEESELVGVIDELELKLASLSV